jgi:hypothetical protein
MVAINNGAGTIRLTLTAAGSAVTGSVRLGAARSDGTVTSSAPVLLQVDPPSRIVYPNVANILDIDLVTITSAGTPIRSWRRC